ncbi:MAG: sulfurtransferase [Chloroflexi bacterium]|nr:sulfurtransferase [Chloroflexota bacterium]
MAEGYVRPDMLAGTDWLAEHLDDPQVRIVDCGPPEAYARAHIPDAVALPVHHYLKGPDNVHVMDSAAFAEAMARLGIGDDTLVVGYDENGGNWAARLWWVLRYYGHDNARVLNGGWDTWLAEGRPLSRSAPQPSPATFTARVRRAAIARSDDVRACIHEPGAVILDVRSPDEYMGEERRTNQRVGHIPGAVNIEWSRALTDDERRTWRPAPELRALYEAAGVTPDRDIITH